MTGLENQREFGNNHFAISEQSLRHVATFAILLALSLLATEFFSVWFIYGIVGLVGAVLVIAFVVDIQHREQWRVEDEQ